MNKKVYSHDEVYNSSVEYFNGDFLAASTVQKKYLLRNLDQEFVEKTPDDMHIRLATEFSRVEKKLNPKVNEAEYFQKVYGALKHFKRIVPQGSPMSAIGNPYQLQSLSNCFVVASPSDSISGIFKTGLEMAQIQKRRGGVGVDLSTLRPIQSRVNNAALVSTGVSSFSDFYSYITRLIGQKGRQGALMLSLSIKHPEALGFAKMKEDLTKVTGANVSFRITDDFMEAVEKDTTYIQQWPVDVPVKKAIVVKEVRARDVWNEIVAQAWKNAEPGLLMWDNYTRELPAHYYPGFLTQSTNPCAELGLSPYDSCRLISMNLSSYIISPFTSGSEFDYDSYGKDVRLAQRMSDGLVELELEAVNKIVESSDDETEKELWKKVLFFGSQGRRTGLGTHGLGDMFLKAGVKYGGEDSQKLSDKVYETHKLASYWESVEMAKERGCFPIWNWELDKKCPFIRRLPKDLQAAIQQYGRRNIANLTVAPTGSVAIASRTSSGVEAVFRWVYDRRVKITHSDSKMPVDYVDANGDKWTTFRVLHPAVKEYYETIGKECPVKEGRDFSVSADEAHRLLCKVLPPHFVASDEVNYIEGVELQGVIQKHIDHGISRTINMPRGTTIEQVNEVYIKSWKLGLKGITIYVDGSRDGVLLTGAEKKDKDKKEESSVIRPERILESHAPKRPKTLPAEVHSVKVKGITWFVVVGLFEGRPYEVFAGQGIEFPSPKDIESAEIAKVASKKYKVAMRIRGNGIEEISDIREIYDSPEQRVITRSVCREMRHGIPMEFIVRDLMEYEGSMVDFTAAMARVLKKYISKPNLVAKSCPSCSGTEFAMHDGCIQCVACGYSKCN